MLGGWNGARYANSRSDSQRGVGTLPRLADRIAQGSLEAMNQSSTLRILDKNHVVGLLDSGDVIDAVRRAFTHLSDGSGRNFDMVREEVGDGAVFGIKSGEIRSHRLLGFKAAGFWPFNRDRGSDAHQATIVLVDPATGRPLCILDGNAVTAMRTGAAGALGIQYLARRDSSRVCLFGTGVQARIQLKFALEVLTTSPTVRYLTMDDRPDASFESQFYGRCNLVHSTQRDESVSASDIVITATPGSGPLFSLVAAIPGTHFNCVGADTKGKRELPAGLLSQADLYVDDARQARQVGETQWAPQTPCTALGDVIAGVRAVRREPTDITVFDMTGFALQDLAVAGILLERAISSGAGTVIDWP